MRLAETGDFRAFSSESTGGNALLLLAAESVEALERTTLSFADVPAPPQLERGLGESRPSNVVKLADYQETIKRVLPVGVRLDYFLYLRNAR